jgi:hypothetical protein
MGPRIAWQASETRAKIATTRRIPPKFFIPPFYYRFSI